MANLYELTGDLLKLQDLLTSGEVIDNELLADVISDTTDDYNEKIESCAKIVKNIIGDVDAIKGEIERLTARKKALENNAASLKARMFDSMKATNKPKIKGALFTVSIQANGGRLPVIVDVPTADLPDNLVKIKEDPDIEAITAFLEKNPNSKLAHFGERGESLRIR